jgi:hypothetical protein
MTNVDMLDQAEVEYFPRLHTPSSLSFKNFLNHVARKNYTYANPRHAIGVAYQCIICCLVVHTRYRYAGGSLTGLILIADGLRGEGENEVKKISTPLDAKITAEVRPQHKCSTHLRIQEP